MRNFERERLLDRYVEAFDTGRLELINEVLKAAAEDQTLVDMIVEVNKVLEEEKGLEPSDDERAEARKLLDNWLHKSESFVTENKQSPDGQSEVFPNPETKEADQKKNTDILMASPDGAQSTGFKSLISQGQKKGIDFIDLASQLRLGISLTRMLDRRQVEFDTIPNGLIEDISQTLELPPVHVISYLNQEQTLAQGALYRANKMPELSRKTSFEDALRLDPHMSEDDKNHWYKVISGK